MHQSSPLASAPIDVLLSISRYLDVYDVLAIRKTCKDLHASTYFPSLWRILLHNEIIARNIPIPGIGSNPGSTFFEPDTSASTLERHLRRALRLRRNWQSVEPTRYSQYRIVTLPEYEDHPSIHPRNVAVHYINSPGGRTHIVSVTVTRGATLRFLQCWDTRSSPPTCIAKRALESLSSIVFNEDDDDNAVLAFNQPSANPSVQVLSVDFSASNLEDGFQTVDNIQVDVERLHTFSGSKLVATTADQQVIVFDRATPGRAIRLASSQVERCMSSILLQNIAILFWPSSVQLYDLSSSILNSNSAILPIAQHRWMWPVDSISSTTHNNTRNNYSVTYPVLGLLVRHSSLFPWPVNLIHRHIIEPNPLFDDTLPMSHTNIPYRLPPVNTHTVASPVRLFSQTAATLGRYGTILWVDNYTEDYFGPSGDGQRLAGLVTSAGLDDGPDGAGLASISAETATSEASSMFGLREHDGWVTLALCEENGDIALGLVTGEIDVFGYAEQQ